MIQFQRLTIRNFMSYGGEQTVHLDNQGIVRLEGINLDEKADSNMAGKSSIIEAICWCLFGKTIRGLEHDQVVNRFKKKDCKVVVSFSIDRVEYICARHRRSGRHKNKLLLTRKDRSGKKHIVSYRHEDQTQKRLESILGCDFRVFSNSVVFGGTRPFASLTDSEQKKVFESFLRFEAFDDALIRTKSKMLVLKEQINEVEKETIRNRGEVAGAKEKIKTIRESQRSIADEKAGQLRELTEQRRKLVDRVGSREAEDASVLERSQKKLRAASKALAVCEAEIDSLKKAITNLDRAKVQACGNAANCPTCGQEITEQSQEAYQAHLKEERISLGRAREVLDSKVSLLRKEEAYAEARLENLLKKKQKVQSETDKRDALEERIRSLRESIRSSSHMEKELDDAIALHSSSVAGYLHCVGHQNLLLQRQTLLQFWETGFGNKGIKSLIVRQALPTLNAKLAEYANRMFGNQATVEFVPTKETKRGVEKDLFHIKYTARRGSDSYKGESSGGRKRVDICILLVFSWLSRISNVLLVDELMDNLDETGREVVLEILSELRGTVLVISHRKELKSKIGKVWTVTKQHGFSTVKTDA